GARNRTYCYQHGVRTGAEDAPHAQCFQVTSDGRFAAVLSSTETAATNEMLPGHAIPGLWDGHGHLLQYGEFLHSVDLFGASSFDEVNRRIVAYVDAHPGAGGRDSWIRGVGWDQMALGAMPTAVSFPPSSPPVRAPVRVDVIREDMTPTCMRDIRSCSTRRRG